MAYINYKGFNKTVATIVDRNSIANKVDHMVVVVQDAIADPSAGAGKATYRWDATDESWILISKSTIDTISFATEELVISGGSVTAGNIPTDNKIWEILVVEGNVVLANVRLEDIVVNNGIISGLNDWEGKKLRFTYAYGTITQQLNTVLDAKADVDYVDAKINNLVGLADIDFDTLGEIQTAIKSKVDRVDVYTKTETDNLINNLNINIGVF